MKKSDIYEIAIKILGLYLMFICIEQLKELLIYGTFLIQSTSNLRPYSDGISQTPIFIITIVNFIFLISLCAVLIFQTKKITKLVCGKEDFDETIPVNTNKRTVYEIALVLVGLLTIILTLPEFAFKLRNHFRFIQSDASGRDPQLDFLIPSGLKIIIGMIAVSYHKTISLLLSGDKKASDNEAS